MEQNNQTNGLAVASLVVGIISIPLGCCAWVGCIAGIIGLVLAILAQKKYKTGMATAGMICSIIGLVLGVIMLVINVSIMTNSNTSDIMAMWESLAQMQ